jgi:hypothetical protein
MWSWLAQVFGSTPTCRIAKRWLQGQRPNWQVMWASVRAREESRDVVAVFYQEPAGFIRPPRYKLLAVSHDLGRVEELPCTSDSPYRIRNYR